MWVWVFWVFCFLRIEYRKKMRKYREFYFLCQFLACKYQEGPRETWKVAWYLSLFLSVFQNVMSQEHMNFRLILQLFTHSNGQN